MTMDPDDLERFVLPVRAQLDDAIAEISGGLKRTHWMWFMFPQLRVLGMSDTARRYGLSGLSDARRLLQHGELGPNYERLVSAVHASVVVGARRIHGVFGSPDDMKLVSSLTLFLAAANAEGRKGLATQCREILGEATRQGLAPCSVTVAALEAETD